MLGMSRCLDMGFCEQLFFEGLGASVSRRPVKGRTAQNKERRMPPLLQVEATDGTMQGPKQPRSA